MDNGFIPLYRRIFEHPLWCEDRPYSRFEAWIDLLQSARFEDTTTKKIINGKVICWNRGQLPISISYLEKRWNWTTKRVRLFLKMLKDEGMITASVVKGNPTTILTICKYEYYNDSGKAEGKGNGKERAWIKHCNCDNYSGEGQRLGQAEGKGGAKVGQQVVEQGEQRYIPPYSPPGGGTGGVGKIGRSPLIPPESLTELPGRAEAGGGRSGPRRFRKPTQEEVAAYCAERRNGVDPAAFVDFYESKGWMIGRNEMKDWRAAVRTWEKNRPAAAAEQLQPKPIRL